MICICQKNSGGKIAERPFGGSVPPPVSPSSLAVSTKARERRRRIAPSRQTDNGGAHNVVSADESAAEFQSGEVVASEGATFERGFRTPGAHLYYCAPHQAVGMHGAIVVEE
nr:plastocyanin/azurin family copper-binding protein [Halovenus carboxidivorans]